MRLITRDDIIELVAKAKQRGLPFLLSKLSFSGLSRTRSAFDKSAAHHSNWWIIPRMRERWNKLVSGDPKVSFREYFMKEHLAGNSHLKLLSLGSGSCGQELALAGYPQFDEITCVDLARNRLEEARKSARERGIEKVRFLCADFNRYDFPDAYYDVVFFNSSLHHVGKVAELLKNKVAPCLKPSGRVIINEYVGPSRLQFPKSQIRAVNQALAMIPPAYRKRYMTRLVKKKFHGSGIIRMRMADPSECADSASILPALRGLFIPEVEKPYGGNILMHVLKDISHHFTNPDPEREKILEALIRFEDSYLETHRSDYLFGIYRKPGEEFGSDPIAP